MNLVELKSYIFFKLEFSNKIKIDPYFFLKFFYLCSKLGIHPFKVVFSDETHFLFSMR